MWLARDKDKDLWIYFKKPKKYPSDYEEVWRCKTGDSGPKKLRSDLFPEVQWEDEEPKFIRLFRKEWMRYICG